MGQNYWFKSTFRFFVFFSLLLAAACSPAGPGTQPTVTPATLNSTATSVQTQPATTATLVNATATPVQVQTATPAPLKFTAIAAGEFHTCALTSAGGVKCWGDNANGQLGDGTTTQHSTPVDVSGLASGVTAIATGIYHTCALTDAGGVKCWGFNKFGQLGNGTTADSSIPVDVIGLTSGVTALAVNGFFACALTTGGGVKCWGYNNSSQLGDGTTTNRSTPVDVSGLTSGMAAIAAGTSHACALSSAGGVKCWGINQSGQVGDGSTTNRPTPVDVKGLSAGVTAITAGTIHTCALVGGGAKCWGYNQSGQLGDGSTTNRSTPVDVSGLTSGVKAITAGNYHTCAITTGGVKCWGINFNGQLGDGSTTNRSSPVDVTGLASGETAISAGYGHTCALASGGGAKCWGGDNFGQLGNGTLVQRSTAQDVTGLASGVTAIAAGDVDACAVTSAGGVKCWGNNGWGQLGDGTLNLHSTPVDVTGLASGATSIAVNGLFACALVSGASSGDPKQLGVKCWGFNVSGQLGNGTTTASSTPVDVTGLASGVTAISAGYDHACALVSAGGVKCWGSNQFGQLGNGATKNSSTAVAVAGLASGVTAISAGYDHACAVVSGGGVKCWGNNALGQLGDGTTTASSKPVDVTGLTSGVTAIAAGNGYSCALAAGSVVKCWGDNTSGQLGNGATTASSKPVDVTGLASGVTAIAAGNGFTCALAAGGAAKCWGNNASGQLGDGTTTNRSAPVDVSGLASGVTAISAGSDHTCALVTSGGVKCWGGDSSGQLGLGTGVESLTPVAVVQ